MTRSVPDLLLERYRLNELPDAQRAWIDREAAGNPSVSARLEALDRSDADIRDQYPASALVPGRPRRYSLRGMVLASAFAATVLAIVVALPHAPGPLSETERIKGSPMLAVYRRTAAGSERLADGDVARAGDLLRLGYASAGRKYGLILSIDGTGAVTLHLPPSGDRAVPLGQGGLVLLNSSYELDDAPRIERFYFVTGARAFDAAPVVAAAKNAGAAPDALSLPTGLDQVTFAIRKEARR